MSQYGRRFAMHEFEIAACEPDALWRRGQQPARLSDEPLGVLFGDRRRFLRQRFIDQHDECRKPGRSWVCLRLRRPIAPRPRAVALKAPRRPRPRLAELFFESNWISS